MSVDLVFNELSVREAPAAEAARAWMAEMVLACNAAQMAGAGRVLLIAENVANLVLAPDYSVWQWSTDPSVDPELRRKFLAIATYGPFTDKLLDEDTADQLALTEYAYRDRTALGLGVAHILDGLAISAPSEDDWAAGQLRLQLLQLEEDASLSTREIDVRQVSTGGLVAEHQAWIAARAREGIADGADLWARRAELFGALTFCDRVADQLGQLGRGDPHLRQVMRKLVELNDYFDGWRDGPFDAQAIANCTGESQVTLERFADDHSFACPDGETRLFSWHVRLTPGAWRLFFAPDPATRRAIVGHIGPKLRNVSYTT